jgi:Glycosyltransferase family 87
MRPLAPQYWEAGALLAACMVASAVVLWRRWSPPVVVSLVIGLVVRVLMVHLAYGHTPHDVAVSMQTAGQDVLHGRDPLVGLPRYQWNFLPFSAYLFAAEIKTGLSWQNAGKILPVGCDLATIVLVGIFVRKDSRDNVRLLYALSPVAVMVSAWHGQIEPIAIALGLSALLLAKGSRAGWSGIVMGFAVASKNWPVLFVPGMLRALPVRKWWIAVVSVAAVLVGWILVVRVVLHDGIRRATKIILGYRSFSGTWGWSGITRYLHESGVGYSGPQVSGVQRVGTVLTLLAILGVIGIFHRRSPEDLTLAVLLAFLVTTAGAGPQYLLWPAALLYAARRVPGYVYLALASIYVGLFYLYAFPRNQNYLGWPGGVLEGLSIAIILAAIASMPWRSGTWNDGADGDAGVSVATSTPTAVEG